MIVIIGSNKGGTGKTTTATNIALALAYSNYDVCLVDADFQRSASRWHQDRQEAKLMPSITLIEKYDNISTTLEELNKKFNYIIVDVAGRNSREMITGFSVADVLISPHQASQLDLDTIVELQEQIIRVKDINPKLSSYILHTMASTNPTVRTNERKEFFDYLSDFPQLKLLNTCCYYRKIYRDVMPLGKAVIEYNNLQAKNEILELIKEVF
ncbi:division plane positioning ATPase MipZ [Rickettsia endosymbiont of Gonocerus acuteangulatus]|uniref:division plane positioning ATPase MipZ n=1 Tax=Rickettsia endosymbiont of Gonocerus acuteangulatus TaxID=3066266 RepID=UPI003132C4B9